MSVLYLAKNKLNQLEADNAQTENIIEQLAEHEVIKVRYRKPTRYYQQKKYDELLRIVFYYQRHYKTEYEVSQEIKLRAGFYDEHITTKGKMLPIPKNTPFDELSDVEFDEFFEKAKQVSINYLINPNNYTAKKEILNAANFID